MKKSDKSKQDPNDFCSWVISIILFGVLLIPISLAIGSFFPKPFKTQMTQNEMVSECYKFGLSLKEDSVGYSFNRWDEDLLCEIRGKDKGIITSKVFKYKEDL